MELMSIYVYILVTDTFIIVCYNKKEREKKRARERGRETTEKGERSGRLSPPWRKFTFLHEVH